MDTAHNELPDRGDIDGSDLPDMVRQRLLERWLEPHRHYHGIGHLKFGLDALGRLGGGRLERIAYWCHDAVHTNTSPADEHASVDLAEELLWGRISDADLDEVTRLILVTIHHSPVPDDVAGARISDADLAGLALEWDDYLENAAGIRAELPGIAEAAWRDRRAVQLELLLARERIFHTDYGFRHWEDRARVNMLRELAGMR